MKSIHIDTEKLTTRKNPSRRRTLTAYYRSNASYMSIDIKQIDKSLHIKSVWVVQRIIFIKERYVYINF